MNDDALPPGTRLRGGAVLIEQVLRRHDKVFFYRAYDVPARREIVLSEYFPDGARRDIRAVTPPAGWSAAGFQIARQKFLSECDDAVWTFEENDTAYVAREYSVPGDSTNSHATVALASTPSAPQTKPSIPTSALREDFSPPRPASSAISKSRPRPSFSLRDVFPDAKRGAIQGTMAGAVSGVLLGVIAALFGNGDIVSGAARGLMMLPVGALAGALLGILRALPSNAPQLASASPRTRANQVQSTLSGAGKGALMGLVISGVFQLAALFAGTFDVSAASLFKTVVLFSLAGAFSGGIVGLIRINPRDRARR
jgi:hypothetical protein